MFDKAVAEDRFQSIYATYERHILAYCLRRIDREQAIDCTAETFLVAWRRISDVPDGDGALPWLYRTAHHVIGDHYRRRMRHRRLVDTLIADPRSEPSDDPETVVVRREADAAVIAALQSLRPADQEILRLAVWEELSHREIGDLLGCSTHAVDQRVHRATRRLGHALHSTHRAASHATLRVDAQGGE